MSATVQTITATTGSITSPSFRFNPQNTLLSFSAPSVTTSIRFQMSVDNGVTWEPGLLYQQNLTASLASIVSLGKEFLPAALYEAPILWRLNATVAANYTMKIITLG